MNARNKLVSAIFGAWIAAAAALGCCAPASAQAQAAGVARLEISGAVPTPLLLSAVELRALPRATARVGGQDGQAPQVYEGVALAELLRRAGVPRGGDLGGPWMAAYAVATAADGYRAAFSLAELTEGLGATEVVVADTLDGAPLGDGQGPFRLVVPSDKRAARWVRMLKSIRVEQPSN